MTTALGPNPLLLTAQEVCDRLSIAKATLYRMISRGEFPKGLKHKKSITWARWPEKWVEEYLEKLARKALCA